MQPSEAVVNSLAAATEGFAGADLQALCASAVLSAVHRSVPGSLDEPGGSVAFEKKPMQLANLKVVTHSFYITGTLDTR